MSSNSQQFTGYHGTRWERPLMGTSKDDIESATHFDDLDPLQSDFNAVFFSDNIDVAKTFAEIRSFDEENDMQVIIESEVSLKNILAIKFEMDKDIEFQGGQYTIPHDRPALYSAMKTAGYDGFVMTDDYSYHGTPGNDVAVFDTESFEAKRVMMKINDSWTPWMDIDQARKVFSRWAKESGLEATPDEPCYG